MLTGILKVLFPLNLFYIQSDRLRDVLMTVAVFGFTLVGYVHLLLNEPIQENIAVVVIPFLMAAATYGM